MFIDGDKGVIKDGFIVFLGKDYSFKLEVKKASINTNYGLYLTNYKNYAFFDYNKTANNQEEYDLKPHNLNQKDLIKLDSILHKCFVDNKNVYLILIIMYFNAPPSLIKKMKLKYGWDVSVKTLGKQKNTNAKPSLCLMAAAVMFISK